MNMQVAELRAAFDGVWARFDPPRTAISVIGMALPLGVGKEAPTRMMVFPLGEPRSNDERKWRFTKADLARAAEHFAARTEPMPILYDHGNDPNKGSKAAGWVDSVDLQPDGLYANCHWTDQARQEIRAGEWGFRSPGWEGEEDPLGFIYAGPLNEFSLVNKPAIGGMSPNVASVNPEQRILDLQPTPPVKEQPMAIEVTAAKKAAVGMDKVGILEAIKKAYPGSDVFGDDVLAGLVATALEGGEADPANPMMPGAEAKPPSPPAVPLFTSAEDVAKHVEAATAAATKELNERIKSLEARELTGKIVNASAADRVPAPTKTFAERIREQRVAGMRS